MSSNTDLTILFDSVSIRRVAKAKNVHTDYTGLMNGIKMVFNVVDARLYVIKNIDSENDKFNGYLAQVERAGFSPVVQEVRKTDGFFCFTPQLCVDAMECKTEHVGIGTTDVSVLPLLQKLRERGHTVVLFGIEPPEIMMQYVNHFYTAAK